MMNCFNIQKWTDRIYPELRDKDAVVQFVEEVSEHVHFKMVLLDIGAGAGELNQYNFRGNCKEIIGVDLDERVVDNPLLDRGIVASASAIPLPDHSVDLAFSVYVLEHIEDPDGFVSEVKRVLKPGGQFWCVTPNRYHYVPIIARWTSTIFHKWINDKRGRDEEDTFPTYYRMNCRKDLRRIFDRAGMKTMDMKMVEVCPNYLLWNPLAFWCGVAYERLVNSTELLAGLRVNIICGVRKLGD